MMEDTAAMVTTIKEYMFTDLYVNIYEILFVLIYYLKKSWLAFKE